LALAGSVVLLVTLLLALFPTVFATHDPIVLDLPARLSPPSAEHFFGTDDFGRDVYSRIVHGTRYSIFTAGILAAS
jgi:peptide/nickel transport system permease protein